MDGPPSPYHRAIDELNKIHLALQILDHQTLLIAAEHQIVAIALEAAEKLAVILRKNLVIAKEQPPSAPNLLAGVAPGGIGLGRLRLTPAS
jgi:hypothetical protein